MIPEAPASPARDDGVAAKLVLVGNPNVGKSSLFGALTGRYATISNYPGTTVEVTRGTTDLPGETLLVIDTPGTNSFLPMSEDERVTRDILLRERCRAVVQVGDAKNLTRTLALSLQLGEMGLPFVLCLNMSDEAALRGLAIDVGALEEALGVPVVSTVAVRRQGLARLREALSAPRSSTANLRYPASIEAAIGRLADHLPVSPLSRRSLAVMLLSGDDSLVPWLRSHVSPEVIATIEREQRSLESTLGEPVGYAVDRARLRAAGEMAGLVSRRDGLQRRGWLTHLERWTIHPVAGLLVLAAVLYLIYQFVGVFGAGTLVDLLETRLFGGRVAEVEVPVPGREPGRWQVQGPEGADAFPGATRLRTRAAPRENRALGIEIRAEEWSGEEWQPRAGHLEVTVEPRVAGPAEVVRRETGLLEILVRAPPGGAGPMVRVTDWDGWLIRWASRGVEAVLGRGFLYDLLMGDYGVASMALTYALALILPIVTTFFLAFGFLEDSGYLPRLAVMVDRLFRAMGLNGKAVLPMVLGLGCDTMATLTTRILETRKERIIVVLLLALGIPCSAQMTVILAMLSDLSWMVSALWAAIVLGVLLLVGFLAARVLPGRGSDFVLELPPLRLPAPGNILVKTLGRLEWYLREAVPLFVLGTLVLFVADRLALLEATEHVFAPVVQDFLGLPARATEAFLIGFLRRDFGAAGLFQLAREGAMDTVAVLVAVTTITLFIPCIAHLFMIIKEQGWKVALAVSLFIFPFALAVGGLLNFGLRALGVTFEGGVW